MKSSHNMDYDLEDVVTLSVDFTFIKGCDAVMYLPNGDPGYPAEPDEVEIDKVMIGKVDITNEINAHGLEILQDAAIEYVADMDE